MRNFRLLIEYDGTEFHGWQVQPELRTVQGVLAEALEKQLGAAVKITGAGRTDAGVHALGQTASFQSPTRLPVEAVAAGTNSLLPDDVRIISVREAPEGFDARRSCIGRVYRYTLIERRSPLRERYAGVVKYALDLELMNRAAAKLPGRRDFSSFGAGDDDSGTKLCRVEAAGWRRVDDRICFDVRADRFLRGMVRAMVGTMIDIGRGRTAPEEMEGILEARDRSRAGPAAQARGLCLMRTIYPDDPETDGGTPE